MVDTREGQDRVVFRSKGKSHEKEGSAPQMHLQVSSAQGGPSPGTSSNIRGDLPDAHKKREEGSAPRNFARSTLNAAGAGLAAAVLGYCLWRFFRQDQRKPPRDPDTPDTLPSSSPFRENHFEAGEGISVITSPPGNSGLTQGGDGVGLHGHKEQLIKLLLKGSSRTADVLVRGQSGMTTLIREVCEDLHARGHFDSIAWISVPRKYDSEWIREEILVQLLFENTPFPDDFDTDHLYSKYSTNSSEYNKARCLIVVDNLIDRRARETFQKVSRLFETFKVILMARRDSPINTYDRKCVIYELEDLYLEEPWAHFLPKKTLEKNFPSPLKEVLFFGSKPLNKVCQLVIRKFESLPGGIVLHLRNRKERNDEWAPMSLPSDNLPSFNLIRQVLEILSNDERRFCLLYLSIFPKSSLISCKRVFRLWAAEGFLGNCFDDNLGRAESFLQKLLDRKCINPVEKRSNGELSTFEVDNLVREIIVSFSDHLDQLRITSEGIANSPERARYLSVQGGTVKDLNEEKLSQLHSLFMFDASSNKDETTSSKASPLGTSNNALDLLNFKFLEVLDLTGAPLEIVAEAIFMLIHLKYLSLRDTSIEVIPDSIRKLEYLEFLDLKHSLVTELPKKAEGLKRIRHILIYHFEKDPLMESYELIGFKALCRVRELKCLEKLCFVEADKETLQDLVNLTKLRRLGITKLRKEHGELLCTSLGELKELKSLNVHVLDQDEILDLHYRTSSPESRTSPPKSLKHLYLHGRLEKLPDWISSLDGLTKIILRWSHLEEDLLAALGELQNLVELELRRAYDGEQLNFKKGQFPKLKILLLEELEGLRSMSLEQEALPILESLTINRCQWLEEIPSGIENIPKIQKLVFFNMSHGFYEKIKADHGKDNYEKFKHIKEVCFKRWRAGYWETRPFSADEGVEGFAGEH